MFAKHYTKYYDLFNHDKPYEDEIKFVYEWAEKPASILDIGCGTANYWRYFPPATVLFGVDKSPSFESTEKKIFCFDITKADRRDGQFDCATALFDVLNYIEKLDWIERVPIKQGGFFIFDIWDSEKVQKEGFSKTEKRISQTTSRHIFPTSFDGKKVRLQVKVRDKDFIFVEHHEMFIHTKEEIEAACEKEFEIIEIKKTERWQTWYKLKRK